MGIHFESNLSNICGKYPYNSFSIGRIQNLVAFDPLFNLKISDNQYEILNNRLEEIKENSLQNLVYELTRGLSNYGKVLQLNDKIENKKDLIALMKNKYSNISGLDNETKKKIADDSFTENEELSGFFYDTETLQKSNIFGVEHIFIRKKTKKSEFVKILNNLLKIYKIDKQKDYKRFIYSVFTSGKNCFDYIQDKQNSPSQIRDPKSGKKSLISIEGNIMNCV